jgi:hypothetical protein
MALRNPSSVAPLLAGAVLAAAAGVFLLLKSDDVPDSGIGGATTAAKAEPASSPTAGDVFSIDLSDAQLASVLDLAPVIP